MSMLSNLELIRRVPLFALLTSAQAESVADAVVKRRFRRGETIVEQGHKSNTLFILLTGRARVPVETGRDTIAQLMNEMPALPSLKGHGISDEIDAIVMKALQPDPAARYANAGAMKYALDQIATTAEDRLST